MQGKTTSVLLAAAICAAMVFHAWADDGAGSGDMWENMYKGGLISEEEYRYAIEKGSLPSSGTTETSGERRRVQAAERPVIRLDYASRKARMQPRLVALGERLRREEAEKYERARAKAEEFDLPLRIELEDGTLAVLEDFRHGAPVYRTTCNNEAADTLSTDEVWPMGGNGFYLTGNSVTMGIWEAMGTVRTTHVAFSGRVNQIDTGYSQTSHATGVAGTLIAAGPWAFISRGMSYEAALDAYDTEWLLTELAEVGTNDMRVSNHSHALDYGWFYSGGTWFWFGDLALSTTEDAHFGRYDYEAREADEIVYESTYHLPVFAAGNDRGDGPSSQPIWHTVFPPSGPPVSTNLVHDLDGGTTGYDCISGEAIGKNVLTVGSVRDIVGGWSQSSDVILESYSGLGPTDDGRIKPDIVANGQNLFTPTVSGSYNDRYAGMSGTSFSTPNVSGSLGLLLELQQDLHGTNSPLWASTLKAIVIHTADEAGSYDGPDYKFGWGLMNTFRAAQVMTNDAAWDSRPHIKEVTLPDGDYVDFDINSDGSDPLRVTICWSDPEGQTQPVQLDPTNIVLINDLDLRVVGPDASTTNYPWALEPTNITAAATTGDNIRDNVEQVVIESPTNGCYTVRVTHKGSLAGDMQDLSIVVTGNIPTNAPELMITDIETESSGYHRVEWPAVVGDVHRIVTKGDLMDTNDWSTADDISITKDTMLWSDQAYTGSVDSIRFYRVQEIE